VLQCVAVYYSVLQCVVLRCSVYEGFGGILSCVAHNEGGGGGKSYMTHSILWHDSFI